MYLADYSPVYISLYGTCLFWNSKTLLTYGRTSAEHKAKLSMFTSARPWNLIRNFHLPKGFLSHSA